MDVGIEGKRRARMTSRSCPWITGRVEVSYKKDSKGTILMGMLILRGYMTSKWGIR